MSTPDLGTAPQAFTSKELALGIGSTTPNVKGNDTRLDFEFYRLPVELSSFNVYALADVVAQ